MTDLDNQINPCPFCGTETKEVFVTDDGYFLVKCRGCGACGPEAHFSEGQSRRRAIALWNRVPLSLHSLYEKTPTAPQEQQEGASCEP